MPSKQRYYFLKEKGICTECAKRPATHNTRCDRCYSRNQTAKISATHSISSNYSGVIGITLEQFKRFKENPNGICPICKEEKKLVFDHCHVLNKFRGFICGSCNTGLGFFKDSIDSLENAILYLNEFGEKVSQ